MQDLPLMFKNRAKKLAVLFLEENRVPTRFRPGSKINGRFKKNSNIEEEFNLEVKGWENVIFQMLESNMDIDFFQSLVFLELNPEENFASVSENESFLFHLNYLIYRRDICNCPDDELGKLVMLMGAYQSFIEKHIKKSKGLKNPHAQELMEKGSVEIDGHLIKLWRGHSRDTVALQQDWNKVKSLGELNKGKGGEREYVVFSGMFQVNRNEVAQYASDMGFRVQSEINGKTSLFIFASENVSPTKVADFLNKKSKGQKIEIVDENAFLEMVLENNPSQG